MTVPKHSFDIYRDFKMTINLHGVFVFTDLILSNGRSVTPGTIDAIVFTGR